MLLFDGASCPVCVPPSVLADLFLADKFQVKVSWFLQSVALLYRSSMALILYCNFS